MSLKVTLMFLPSELVNIGREAGPQSVRMMNLIWDKLNF